MWEARGKGGETSGRPGEEEVEQEGERERLQQQLGVREGRERTGGE